MQEKNNMFMEWFLALPFGTQLLIVYVIVINIATFFFFGFDKLKAHWESRRVSERMLWGLSLLGGTPGAFLAMYFFRHKTKKLSFQAGMAVILMIHGAVLYWWFSR